jgi:hypothetical protein
VNHTCRVHFKTWRSAHGTITDESVEDHTMRYFFQPELEKFFAAAGMESCGIRPFEDLDAEPNQSTWNVWACARLPEAR